MVYLNDVGGIAGVIKSLTNLAVPQGVIDELVTVLHEESDTLQDGKPVEVPADAFGGRSSADYLAHHTRLAHQHLANSVLEAVASLQGTGDAVKQFNTDIQDTDADAHAATTVLLHRTQHAIDQMDDDRYTPPTVPATVPAKGSKP